MNKQEIAQQDVNKRVCIVLNSYGEKVASIPFLASSAAEFILLTDSIDSMALDAKSISIKPGTTKQELRSDLQYACLRYGKTAMVYARSIEDQDAITNIVTIKSDISRLNDYNFSLYSKYLVNYSADNAEGLLTVGLTAEKHTALENLVNEYDGHIEEPREDINKRKDINNQIEQMIKDSSDALADVFDGLIETFPEDDPFYIAYQSARIVISPATRHRKDDDDDGDDDDDNSDE